MGVVGNFNMRLAMVRGKVKPVRILHYKHPRNSYNVFLESTDSLACLRLIRPYTLWGEKLHLFIFAINFLKRFTVY